MMLVNRKQDPLPRKPLRFNLGDLIKKKITWRRSIDSLAAPLFAAEPFAYPSYDPKYEPKSFEPKSFEPKSFEPKAYEALPKPSFDAAAYTHRPEERYTSFTTECISLLNSDMTSHMDYDDALSVDSYVPFDAAAEEPCADYRHGGYHPVKLGDTFHLDSALYRVVRKLGWGHFSTVWLCVADGGRCVAMKIVKLGKNYTEAARDEIRILRLLQDDDDLAHGPLHVVRLLDDFTVPGPNGVHVAMAFELMGENMLHLIYKHKLERTRLLLRHGPLVPFAMAKQLVRQVLASVDTMHRRGVVHTDLKPENILLATSAAVPAVTCRPNARFQILPSQPVAARVQRPVEVKLADLGNATFANLHFTNHIQTRQYRAPEVILGHEWGALADVWSIGCLVFELLTGDYLFDPHDGLSFTKDEDHVAMIVELLGAFPLAAYLARCEQGERFFAGGALRNIPSLKVWPLEKVLEEKYKFDPAADDVRLVCDFMRKCLTFELDERHDCGLLLQHPWLRDGAHFSERECSLVANRCGTIAGWTCEE